jgi:hypothetical protein
MKKKSYTVVGLYEPEGEAMTHHVKAADPSKAIAAFAKIIKKDAPDCFEKVSVVACFEGNLIDVFPNAMATYCPDVLGE